MGAWAHPTAECMYMCNPANDFEHKKLPNISLTTTTCTCYNPDHTPRELEPPAPVTTRGGAILTVRLWRPQAARELRVHAAAQVPVAASGAARLGGRRGEAAGEPLVAGEVEVPQAERPERGGHRPLESVVRELELGQGAEAGEGGRERAREAVRRVRYLTVTRC